MVSFLFTMHITVELQSCNIKLLMNLMCYIIGVIQTIQRGVF